MVDGDQDVAPVHVGDVTRQPYIGAEPHRYAGAQHGQLVVQQQADASRRLTRQHVHLMAQVGEGGRHLVEGGRRRRLERARDIVELDGAGPAQHVGGRHLPDPFGCGPQALAELVLDGALERREPVVAELAGEAHDGGAAGGRPGGEVGHGPEGHALGRAEDNVGEAAFGGREGAAGRVDHAGDGHGLRPSRGEIFITLRESQEQELRVRWTSV